jgi:5-methyltetrahydropteroyltriglutamate--homocysteine methyltransferase
MKRSDERILTTHAGSLPRPPRMREDVIASERRTRPAREDERLAVRVRGAVAEVVTRQVAAGLDCVNDGELGKSNFTWYAASRLGGLEIRPSTSGDGPQPPEISGRDRRDFPGYFEATTGFSARLGPRPEVVCAAPLSYAGRAELQADIDGLRAALAGAPAQEAFLTAVAPGTIEHWLRNDYYPSEEAHLYAIADAIGHEYRAITEAGFVLQVDDPDLFDAWQIHTDMTVAEYRRFAELRVDALNHALRGIPPERVRLHVCWGSYHGPHKHDLPLRDVVDLMLTVRAGAYSIEASNPRHDHEWRVWEDVALPEGKLLIPGVVGHASDFIEHPRLVADRLERYARLVGRERVIAGTDCGLGGRVGHDEIVWAKLDALVEGARLASEALWSGGASGSSRS